MGINERVISDSMNQDGSSDSVLSSDVDKETSEVIADKDFIIGEEVFIRYGKFSNATLMLSFGFTVSYNTHDQVQICFAIDQHDPLCTMKVELLHKHHMPTKMISDNGLKSCGIIFTINQVTNVNGKGRGIPQSLRAFSRVLVTSEPEDLDEFAREAALNDGRLARHKLENSLGIVDCQRMSRKMHIRTCMAIDLLAGELRVLKSASAWLSNYCAKLSANINSSP